jgi:hypothetical protein
VSTVTDDASNFQWYFGGGTKGSTKQVAKEKTKKQKDLDTRCATLYYE